MRYHRRIVRHMVDYPGRPFPEYLQQWAERQDYIYLALAPVVDCSALSGLQRMRGLDLYGTLVENVSPFAGLSALRVLTLIGTPVSDASPLSGLVNALINLPDRQVWLPGREPVPERYAGPEPSLTSDVAVGVYE